MYCTVLYCTVLYCSEGIEEPARFRPELHQHPAGGGGLRRHALHQPRGSQPHKLQETFRDILKLKIQCTSVADPDPPYLAGFGINFRKRGSGYG